MKAAPAAAVSFDDVAELYDRQTNPMLALEESYLAGLLPDLRGLDVVDVGCGTGRWLRKLSQSHARTLTGIDPSCRMLEVARRNLNEDVRLVQAASESLPLEDSSVDLVLVSFALSYSDQVEEIARELARVTRPDARIFISDVHPATEELLNWQRVFQSDGGSVAMHSIRHDLAAVIDAFQRSGFRLACLLEPSFGPEERPLFVRAGKQSYFDSLPSAPAIYIAQFVDATTEIQRLFELGAARVAFGATAATSARIEVAGDTIGLLSNQTGPRQASVTDEIDLSGCLVLPGLINAHDHLEFGLYPNLGSGPYRNSREWADDIHVRYRDVIEAQSRVAKESRLYWGALRNLLAGVTTVCHHNPEAAIFRNSEFPVRVIGEIAWAHSLAFDPEAVNKFASSSPEFSFVIHAAEGTDRDTAREIAELEAHGVLSDRTVLVHGLNCSADDAALINARKASLVVCPSSSYFLYERTIDAERLRSLRRVALGTDSPLTAAGDLLDEIKFAKHVLELSPTELYEMCSSRAASILRLRDGQGSIRIGGMADLVVVRDTGSSPEVRLQEVRLEDIELVLIGGRVHLASEDGLRRLPARLKSGLSALRIQDTVRWVRAPLKALFAEAEAMLGPDLFLGNKRVTYVG